MIGLRAKPALLGNRDVPVLFGVTQNVLPVSQVSRNIDHAATFSAIDDVKGRRGYQYAEWLPAASLTSRLRQPRIQPHRNAMSEYREAIVA